MFKNNSGFLKIGRLWKNIWDEIHPQTFHMDQKRNKKKKTLQIVLLLTVTGKIDSRGWGWGTSV